MSFWKNIFARRKRADPDSSIATGRFSISTNNYMKTLSPFRSRTANILEELRSIPDEATAIDFLRKKTPDVSMSLYNFLRLANQGHKMEFYSLNGDKLTEVDQEWRDFASRVNSVSNSGLDGLVDILHASAILFGSQMIEVEVNKDRTDIVDVHPIDPRTITWELEERDGSYKWIPYQMQSMQKVSLEKANLYYVPIDPDVDDPRGNLLLAPAVQAIDYELQTLQDVAAVLRRQGYPRNDISINLERLISSMPPSVRNNEQKQREFLQKHWNKIRDMLRNLEPTDDFLHYDDVTINMNEGANASRSLDVRAVQELIDAQVLNGLKELGTLANRINSKTETWSSVELKIRVQGILSIQRCTKRLIESIAKLWCRVHGIQAVPVFTFNPVEWQSELDKIEVKLKQQQFYAIAVALGWINNDQAASQVIGVEKAVGDMPPDAVRISYAQGGESSATEEYVSGQLQLPLRDGVLRLRRKNGSART